MIGSVGRFSVRKSPLTPLYQRGARDGSGCVDRTHIQGSIVPLWQRGIKGDFLLDSSIDRFRNGIELQHYLPIVEPENSETKLVEVSHTPLISICLLRFQML